MFLAVEVRKKIKLQNLIQEDIQENGILLKED
jgi:hypothetical protein